MSLLDQVEEKLINELEKVVQQLVGAAADIPKIHLEQPKDKAHGDFATNIAMQLARLLKKSPRQIAEDIVANLDGAAAGVEKVEIAGPGFINFFMKNDFLANVVATILAAGDDYGKSDHGADKRVQVEYVSVNPTGDLHLGHARGAAYGDVLANVLATAGYDVEREYYINDAGNQIDQLAVSIEARYLEALGVEAEMPEDGYYGQDIIEIGRKLAKEHGDSWANEDRSKRLSFFRDYGLTYELDKIKRDLDAFGVHFDNWFSETSLYENGQVINAVKELTANDFTYEKEGATWFKSTIYGDDKDRVLIKNDGTYTYLTPDIAYHKDKLERGFDHLINVWGADHHGYVPRMQAAIQALGYPADKLTVSIIQLVNLFENGEKVRMSKRTGKAVALRELMDDVGKDAVRYFFVMRSNDSPLDFNLDLARSESNENPVYYVQYAHARICSMLRNAAQKGFTDVSDFDATLLTAEKEVDLLKQLGAFPQVIVDAAEKEAPYRMPQYAFELATLLHSFYNAEKVIDETNVALTKARIALMQAVKITLANVAEIIGITAPESMKQTEEV